MNSSPAEVEHLRQKTKDPTREWEKEIQ